MDSISRNSRKSPLLRDLRRARSYGIYGIRARSYGIYADVTGACAGRIRPILGVGPLPVRHPSRIRVASESLCPLFAQIPGGGGAAPGPVESKPSLPLRGPGQVLSSSSLQSAPMELTFHPEAKGRAKSRVPPRKMGRIRSIGAAAARPARRSGRPPNPLGRGIVGRGPRRVPGSRACALAAAAAAAWRRDVASESRESKCLLRCAAVRVDCV